MFSSWAGTALVPFEMQGISVTKWISQKGNRATKHQATVAKTELVMRSFNSPSVCSTCFFRTDMS